MKPIILIACFTSLAAVFVVAKVAGGCPQLIQRRRREENHQATRTLCGKSI